MTLREQINAHPWLCGAAAVLMAAVLADLVLMRMLSTARADEAKHAKRLADMETLAADIVVARGGTSAIAIARPGSFTSEAVSRAAQDARIVLASSEGSSSSYDARTIEQVVILSVTAVQRKELAAFLLACEQIDPAVRVTDLRITLNTKSPALVDASVRLAAYESKTAPK